MRGIFFCVFFLMLELNVVMGKKIILDFLFYFRRVWVKSGVKLWIYNFGS